MRSLALCFAAALSVACTSGQSPAPVTHDRAAPPITVRWVVDSTGEGHAHLVARVERVALMNVPATVRFTAPEGAVLSPPAEDFTVPAGGPVVMERAFELTWKQAPAEDLVVTLDVSGPGFGLHGEDAFRFGRPGPQLPRPIRGGESLEVGGAELGQPVQTQP